MAGSLYLGSQKVCPVIVAGQQEPQEYDSLIRMPKGLKELDIDTNYIAITPNVYSIPSVSSEANMKILLDLNELEIVTGGTGGWAGYSAFMGFINPEIYWISIDIKAENLKEAGDGTFQYFATTGGTVQRENSVFYNPIIRFPKLEKVGDRCFYYFVNTGITDIYLPKVKTAHNRAFYNMCSIAQNTITLHFASNQEALISSLSGYPNFGSSYPVTILYDQPPTE